MPEVELTEDQIELLGEVVHGAELQMEQILDSGKAKDDKVDEIKEKKNSLHSIKEELYSAVEE